MEIADWFANAIHRITKIDPCFIVSFIWLRQIGQRWQSHGHSRPVSILDVSLSIVRFFHNGINENVHLFQDHVHSEKFNLSILKSSKCCMLDHGYLVQCMWKSSCYWIIVPIVMNGKLIFEITTTSCHSMWQWVRTRKFPVQSVIVIVLSNTYTTFVSPKAGKTNSLEYINPNPYPMGISNNCSKNNNYSTPCVLKMRKSLQAMHFALSKEHGVR